MLGRPGLQLQRGKYVNDVLERNLNVGSLPSHPRTLFGSLTSFSVGSCDVQKDELLLTKACLESGLPAEGTSISLHLSYLRLLTANVICMVKTSSDLGSSKVRSS